VTGVIIAPKATDISELTSQGVVVGSVGLQQAGVVLTVVDGGGRGSVLLGAGPLQEALSAVESGSPAFGENRVILSLKLPLHLNSIVGGRSIEVEGTVAHEASPGGVGEDGAFKSRSDSVLSVIDSLSVGLASFGLLGFEVLVHGIHHLLLEDVVFSEVA
jgi:hypothetical protein